MKKFPVLLSIPHGGTEVPSEIRDRVVISPKNQFEDSDALTQEIYGLGDAVLVQVQSQIARVYVDMNRAEDDRPPQNPDGVVKTQTCHGKDYLSPWTGTGRPIDPSNSRHLLFSLPSIYRPLRLAEQAGLQLALDCHSMEKVAPVISPDPGQPRPLICLGNNHGKKLPAGDGRTELADMFFAKDFGLEKKDVVLNKPFAGGYIYPKPMERGLCPGYRWK